MLSKRMKYYYKKKHNPESIEKRFAPKNIDSNEVLSYWLEGVRIIDMERFFGVTRRTIWLHLKKFEVYNEQTKIEIRKNYRKNPYNGIERDKRRKESMRNAEGSHTIQEFRWLYAEYNCTCLCCKKKFRFKNITKDHIIPLSKGGSDWIENIQPLCQSCNSSKGTKTINFKGTRICQTTMISG